MITITYQEFKKLAAYVKANYGINLKDEKQTLVNGRLQNVLLEKNFSSFSEYFEYVLSDKTGVAVKTLISKITTNHTFFMRESAHFIYFRDIILPFLKKIATNKDLRIWSAGCSTGEEAYTLAMLLDENLGSEKKLWDSKLLATDISEAVLDKAVKGIYKKEDIDVLPTSWKLNYWNRYDDENVIISDKIRNDVIFRKFNLMNKSFPFKKKFHVIFCRNVMIYFDMPTKRELVNRFYDSLEYGGYLFIGHSESLSREETKLKYIMPAVYRKE